MNASRLLAALMLCLCGIPLAQAQPANANLQLIPPHSPFLENFTQPTSQSLLFTLQLFDHPTGSMDVRLKMVISGAGITLTTNSNWVPPVTTLTTGIPQLFSGYDLIEYFDPYHLDFQGMTRQEFIQNGGKLPEGFYEVCIQAFNYDPTQNIVASNDACATAFLEYYDPPKITQPIGVQTVLNPQHLVFNWLPLHPVGNFITSYDLEIWEIVPNLTWQQITEFEAPFFQTTTTNITSYQYGLENPLLEEGKGYITRVRARAENGSEVFKNDGYSVIENFFWGAASNDCKVPEFAELEVVGVSNLNLKWIPPLGIAYTGFTIRYREVSTTEIPWETVTVAATEREYNILYLLSDRTYQVEIQTNCPNGSSDWLPLEDKVINHDLYACGINPGDYPIDNNTPLNILRPGDIFNAGDFKVEVKNASGSGGKFFGSGYITIPYFNNARVNVNFNNVSINELYYLYQGKIIISGVGVQVIDEEVAGTLQNILDVLDTVDDVLAAAQQIIETIDEMIALVEPYLPDNVISDLLLAQQMLEDALALANDPNATQEEIDAAVAAAQAQVEAAKAAYDAALLAFFEQFFDVLIAAIGELHSDYQAQANQIDTEFNTAETAIDNYLTQINDPLPSGDGYGEDPFIMDVGSSFEDLTDQIPTLRQDPVMDEFINKADTYYEKETPYALKIVIDELKKQIVDVDKSKELIMAFKDSGLTLLETVGQMIKEDKTTEEMVAAAKIDLINGLKIFLLRI